MRDSLGLTIVLYATFLALVCLIGAATGRRRTPLVGTGLVVLEVAVVLQAVLDFAAVVRGQHGGEVAVNVGYLLTSLAVVPVVWSVTRADAGRWGQFALTFGCLLVVVVTLRLHATLVAR